MARQKNCTGSQLALAWVLAQGGDVAPIPGTKRVKYLEENVGALAVQLSAAELHQLDELLLPGTAAGPRGSVAMLAAVGQ